MTADQGRVRFVQHNQDRRQIYAIAERDGTGVAYGPLPLDEIHEHLYRSGDRRGPGDPELARQLAARSGEFHDLDDFFRAYGYPPDVVAWVDATPIDNRRNRSGYFIGGGYDPADVAARLGIDEQVLNEAAWPETYDPRSRDPEGDPMFYDIFWDNWAIGDLSGVRKINPNGYRFKAWLSFNS